MEGEDAISGTCALLRYSSLQRLPDSIRAHMMVYYNRLLTASNDDGIVRYGLVPNSCLTASKGEGRCYVENQGSSECRSKDLAYLSSATKGYLYEAMS